VASVRDRSGILFLGVKLLCPQEKDLADSPTAVRRERPRKKTEREKKLTLGFIFLHLNFGV